MYIYIHICIHVYVYMYTIQVLCYDASWIVPGHQGSQGLNLSTIPRIGFIHSSNQILFELFLHYLDQNMARAMLDPSRYISGISRIRFIHSSNQTPRSSNVCLCRGWSFSDCSNRGVSKQYPLTVLWESPITELIQKQIPVEQFEATASQSTVP